MVAGKHEISQDFLLYPRELGCNSATSHELLRNAGIKMFSLSGSREEKAGETVQLCAANLAAWQDFMLA